MTIFLHETHHVIGAAEDAFEDAFREPGGWMDLLGSGADARLLWFAKQAHGTGPSYRMITVTAVQGGAAWERLARDPAVAEWTRRVDTLRHGVTSKLLLPVSWSPMNEVDLASVPTTAAEHECTLVMEDTGWPSVPLHEYIDYWERVYWPMLTSQPAKSRMLEIQACWTPALGSGRRPEGILWQKIHNHDRLLGLFANEIPPQFRAPGTYMADALTYRDQWESRLLRVAPWSPLW